MGGDYGPYVQSERFDLYRDYVEQSSLQAGRRLPSVTALPSGWRSMRAEQKKATGYDRRCRDLEPADEEERRSAAELGKGRSQSLLVRFKVPLEGSTSFP